MNELTLNILLFVGTVSAAISGAMLGVKKKMDIVGILILGLTTATGGGLIRDMLLGIHPPMMFRGPTYAFTALGTSVLVFLPRVRRIFRKNPQTFDALMLLTDSLGIAVFTVVGIQTGKELSSDYSTFLLVFIGTLTGVGGGILRDLLANQEPYILAKRHFYATTCVAGALLCCLLWSLGELPAMVIGAVVTFTFRMCSAIFRWKIPRAEEDEESIEG